MKKLLFALAAFALSASAHAQSYPTHAIKMIVPISVGSVTDVAARLTAQALQQRLGQPVVVVNKPGAAMVLGGTECAKSAPDGYTLCLVSPDTMSFNPLTVPNLPYDPAEGFRAGHRHVSRHRRPDGAGGVRRRHARRAAQQGGGRARQAQLRHARRAHHHRRVPPMARRILAHQIRGHSLQGRQRDHRRAARQRHRRRQDRRRQHGQPVQGGQDQDAGAERRRSARPHCRTCRPSRKPASTVFPAARSIWGVVVPTGTPAPIVARLHDELLAIFHSQKFTDFAKQNYLEPVAGSTGDFAAFLKKDRQDAKVVVDKYMK